MAPANGRVRVSEACRELGLSKATFFGRQWNHAFTRYRVGRQLRVCRLELDAAKDAMIGDDAEARAKAAVRAVRKQLGRLP